jgi:hypothetical protein
MKDDVKVKVPNKTPKTQIPSNGVVNWDGVLSLVAGQRVTMQHIHEVG